MYRLGNVYFVTYEDFNKKESYKLGLLAAASLLSLGMYSLPVKDAGWLENAVMRECKYDEDNELKKRIG